LPLYAGSVTKERAQELVKLIENEHIFGTPYPLPSVPPNSSFFDRQRYWQGPSWVNMNWFIIDGLKRYGFKDHAAALKESTIEMVEKSGMYEYFDPYNAAPLGAPNFSWTAALIIDLVNS
jgi:glycogen debranching enzyme